MDLASVARSGVTTGPSLGAVTRPVTGQSHLCPLSRDSDRSRPRVTAELTRAHLSADSAASQRRGAMSGFPGTVDDPPGTKALLPREARNEELGLSCEPTKAATSKTKAKKRRSERGKHQVKEAKAAATASGGAEKEKGREEEAGRGQRKKEGGGGVGPNEPGDPAQLDTRMGRGLRLASSSTLLPQDLASKPHSGGSAGEQLPQVVQPQIYSSVQRTAVASPGFSGRPKSGAGSSSSSWRSSMLVLRSLSSSVGGRPGSGLSSPGRGSTHGSTHDRVTAECAAGDDCGASDDTDPGVVTVDAVPDWAPGVDDGLPLPSFAGAHAGQSEDSKLNPTWGGAAGPGLWAVMAAGPASLATAASAGPSTGPAPPTNGRSSFPDSGSVGGVDVQRLQYALDSMLETHPISYLFLLAALVALLVLGGGFLLHTSSEHRQDPYWDAWGSMVSTAHHLQESSNEGRLIGFLLNLGGLIFYSLLISTITAHFKHRMEWLREGAHTCVMEVGHVVIAGVNHDLPALLRSLHRSQAEALRSGTARARRLPVVVIAEQPKKETDKTVVPLSRECPHLKLLVRSGPVTATSSLRRVAVGDASAVIVLASHEDPYLADAEAVTSVMALRQVMESSSAPVVVEVSRDSTAELIQSFGGLHVAAVHDLHAKLFAQCSRQPGLAQRLSSLLGETRGIYLRTYDSLAGLQFCQVWRAFKEAVVLGTVRRGRVEFHPRDKDVLLSGDKLMLLGPKGCYTLPPPGLELQAREQSPQHSTAGCSQDTHSTHSTHSSSSPHELGFPLRQELALESQTGGQLAKERILLLGWRMDVPHIIAEYDQYVGPGSELVVLSPEAAESREAQTAKMVSGPLKNLRVVHRVGSPLDAQDLEAAILDPDSIFAGADRGQGASEGVPFSVSSVSGGSWRQKGLEADKASMYSLFLAALVCKKGNIKVDNLTAEFQEGKLAKEALSLHPSLEYVCTNDIMALLVARVSEQPELNAVWTELLNSWGNEFYVKDMKLYAEEGEEVTFLELTERARRRKEVAVGYRRDGNDVLNPCPKDHVLSFREGDRLIVVSETETSSIP